MIPIFWGVPGWASKQFRRSIFTHWRVDTSSKRKTLREGDYSKVLCVVYVCDDRTLTHAHTYTHTHTRARASSVHTNCTRKRYTGTHTGYVAHGACTFTCVDSSRVTYYAYFSFIFVLFSFFFRIKSFFCCLPSGEKHGKRRVICRSYSNFFSVKFFSNLRHSLFFFYLIYFVFSLFSFSS